MPCAPKVSLLKWRSHAKKKRESMFVDPPRSAADPMALSNAQRRLLRHAFQSGAALQSGSENGSAAFGQRQALRELCLTCRASGHSPEHLLIAFKTALIETADETGIAYGPQRSDLLSRLVSVFIEELYEFRIRKPGSNGDGNGSLENASD